MVRQFKRRHLPRRARQACVRVLTAVGGILLTLGVAGALHYAAAPRHKPAVAGAPLLMPAGYRVQNSSGAEQTAPSLLVAVGTQNADAKFLPSLRDVLGNVLALPADVPENTADTTVPAWHAWARLSEPRTTAQVSGVAADGLGAYAVRGAWGTSLCLVNKTNAPLQTTAQFRLPRGVYTLERLTLAGGEKEKRRRGDKEPERPEETATLHSSPFTSHAYLEGCDAGGNTLVRKAFRLEPGQICLVRCVDSARAARSAWYDVFNRLHGMAAQQPGPAHRLSVMLHEADGYVSGLRGGSGSGGNRHDGEQPRLACIHHLLLVTAQAHSLHHNYQMRHTVGKQAGQSVMEALDRLTESLSETSATLLGLVPQMSLDAPADRNFAHSAPLPSLAAAHGEQNTGENASNKENSAPPSNNSARIERVVTIALTNTGAHSVSNVKLGVNMNVLPMGMTCAPADPAYFGELRPGQTVRATFHVRGKTNAEIPNNLFAGDVSYFAGTAPAHLRPCAW